MTCSEQCSSAHGRLPECSLLSPPLPTLWTLSSLGLLSRCCSIWGRHLHCSFAYEMMLVITPFLFASFPSMNSVPRKWNYWCENTLSPMEMALITNCLCGPDAIYGGKDRCPGVLCICASSNKRQQPWDSCPSTLPGESSWTDAIWHWVAPQGTDTILSSTLAEGMTLMDICPLHVPEFLTHLHLSQTSFSKLPS